MSSPSHTNALTEQMRSLDSGSEAAARLARSSTVDAIQKYSGVYSLPTGVVPYVDGVPQWPYAEAVAHMRLAKVADRAGITLTGDEELVSSGSNDAWLVGDTVVRICWRGDLQRLTREVAINEELPQALHHAETLDFGETESLTWAMSKKIKGRSLSDVWGTASESELRGYAEQLATTMFTLHEWTPSTFLREVLVDNALPPAANALRVVSWTPIPENMSQVEPIIDYLRSVPQIDVTLLNEIADRLHSLPPDEPKSDHLPEMVLLHGDVTPWNVLVHDGRISALLDYEYARFGVRRTDLGMLAVWQSVREPNDDAHRLMDWLRLDYPSWFKGVDPGYTFWRERCAWALRGCVVWPPDSPTESLDEDHPLFMLRSLLAEPE